MWYGVAFGCLVVVTMFHNVFHYVIRKFEMMPAWVEKAKNILKYTHQQQTKKKYDEEMENPKRTGLYI